MSKNNMKLNVLLAKTDHLANTYKSAVKDFISYFKSSQGAFKGEKKTYEPKVGTIDIPSERGNKLVVTTVGEKLKWFTETQAEYIDALFAQEATNASGKVRTNLIIDGVNFGEYSSLELLRLKSLLENGEFEHMYASIPVRNDDEQWVPSTNPMYVGREIFESNLQSGTKKSTMKESYIMSDPNVSKDSPAYKPTVATKDTIIELGDYTFQKFSGEFSHRERAEILRRRSKMLNAVIEALKTANDAEAIESEMTAKKLFNYLHGK